MKSNLGKTALLAASLLYFSGCVTTGADVSAQQQPTPVGQSQSVGNLVSEESPQVQPSSQDLIQYLYPGLETNLTLDIPSQYQDENGLFLVVDRNSDYYNDSWNRGYAGMFTDEDKAGRSIKGYDITLPMQIFGNWSANAEDYFDREQSPWFNELDSSVNLYYTNIKRNLTGTPLKEESPYFELDAAYADMIKADDSLTPDEQLELIIMNHKGYLENLLPNIQDIIEDNYLLDGYTTDGSRSIINTGIDNSKFTIYTSLIGDSIEDEFLIKSIAGLKILEHRLPEIYDSFIRPNNDSNYEIRLDKQRGSAAGMSHYVGNNHILTIYPNALAAGKFETFIGTLTHEYIHYGIQANLIIDFNEEDYAWLNDNSYNSEVVTYGNMSSLAEILNYSSLNMVNVNGSRNWYPIYGDKHFDGEAPLEHFVRIIDNQ